MSKILGLDLGTNSIGWAVVEKNKINNNEYKTTLKDKGVVIFSEGVKIEKGQESSKAAERTDFRSARRIKFRKKLRKYETLLVLVKEKMCPLLENEVKAWRKSGFKKYPNNPNFTSWLQTDNFGEKNNPEHKKIRKTQEDNPYFFRDKFSRQKYDWVNDKTLKEELGRAFYHIAQRRGFLSNRLEQSDDSIIEEHKEKIEEILDMINDSIELLGKINQLFEPFEFEGKNEKDLDATEKKLNRTRKYALLVIKDKVKGKNFSTISEKREEIRKYINKPENIGPVKGYIKTLSNEIEEANCKTLGQYFWNLYKSDRNKPENKIRTNYTAREEHYLHEFEIICKTQRLEGINENEKSPDKKYYGLVKELYNAIFFQRPLKSQKGLVGNCSFEKNKPRCPVSHPLFEEFRMCSFINNIKIKTPDDEKLRALTKEEKEKITPKFYRKSKPHFDFEDIIKELKTKDRTHAFYKDREAKKSDYLFNFKDNTTVSGCPTSANLKSIFGDNWKNVSYNYETINKEKKIINRKVNYHDLWHILTTFTSEDKLKDFALEKLKLDKNDADKFSKISLKKDYASLSLAAINKILPYLKQGLIYSHAVFMANAEKVVDENIWKNEQKRNDLQNEIKLIIENNTLDNQIKQVINGLIKNCKKSNNNFTYNEQSKESYKNDVENALNSFYGKNSWKELENNDRILETSCKTFFEQLKEKGGTGDFIKPKRTDEKVIDLLLGKNETGEIYCSDESRIKKLYHPSDIEKFKPIIIKDKNDNKFIGLGNPATPSVRNPMAMRSLFQLRKLINTLTLEEKIDQNTKINIELARELNDANKRNAIERWQREKKELHDIYAKKIKELYLAEQGKEIEPSYSDILKFQMALEQREDGKIISKEDILKYQLWEEQKHICLYTGNTIGLTDFLNENPKYDIEHTIPRSISEDNSQMNKTLCDNKFNRDIKKQQIPFELSNYDKILPRIEHWKKKYEELDNKIAQAIRATRTATTKEKKDRQIRERHYLAFHREYWKGKYERFTMKDVPQSFKNSQKVDIGIISKYAREYLSSVFKNKYGNSNVSSIKGEMTAEFRKAWGLQESYYNEFGKKNYKPKDRSNHIHHCIDAITIACIDKNKYDTLAQVWSLEDKGELNKAREELEKSKPWKSFTQDVKTIIDEVVIVHNKPDNVKKQSKKALRKRGKKQYVIEYEKDSRGKRVPKRDRNDKIIYKPDKEGNKIPIIQQGDTVRGSLHQDTFYGAIKQPELENVKMKFDENGRKILKKNKKTGKEEIKYVVKRILSNLEDKDIKNIVDERIKMIVLQGRKKEKELKNEIEKLSKDIKQAADFEKSEIEKQITTLKNKIEKKLYVIPPKNGKNIYTPIRKVRCIANDVKTPLKIKEQRTKSKKEYKQHFNVKNEENYCMAIYEIKDENGKIKRSCKLVNMLEAGQYYKLSNKKHRKLYPIVPEKNIENEYSLKYILTKGLMVLLYEKHPEKIWEISDKERLTRLYEITQLDTEQSCIKLLYHQEAREKNKITKYMGLKSGMKGGKNIGKFKEFPWIKIGPNDFDALVEGFDFNITPTGKIKKI